MSEKTKDKSLKTKAVKIKGKDYVLVSDRILYFNDNYPNGCIVTELLVNDPQRAIFKAIAYPDGIEGRYFTGYSQEVDDGSNFINKTSMIENCETSAVGRALAMMGIGVIDSIASVDEINKANNRSTTKTYKLNNNVDNGVKKICAYCGKEHNGKYDKCYNCYTSGNNTKLPEKKTLTVNEDNQPF